MSDSSPLSSTQPIKLTSLPDEQETSSSRINPHLDLSRIKSLSLQLPPFPPHDNYSWPSHSFRPPPLSFSRRSSSDPLPINSIRLSLDYEDRYLLSYLHRTLLPNTNPLQLEYDVHNRPPKAHSWFSTKEIPLLGGWTRLQCLMLKGVIEMEA